MGEWGWGQQGGGGDSNGGGGDSNGGGGDSNGGGGDSNGGRGQKKETQRKTDKYSEERRLNQEMHEEIRFYVH